MSQISHHNRDPRTYGASDGRVVPIHGGTETRKKFIAKGHDAQLQDAQYGKFEVRLALLSGDKCYGTVVKRDKFTITLRHNGGEFDGQEEIFYKHAIESVLVFRDRTVN